MILAAPTADDRPCVIVVVGAPGTPEYEAEFRRWADLWQDAAAKAGGRVDPDRRLDPTRPARPTATGSAPPWPSRRRPAGGPLWLVLIGHGSFDGREAKFNLRGPDVTDAELADWLAPIKRPVAVLDCSSASGPFLNRLSGAGPGRRHGDPERAASRTTPGSASTSPSRSPTPGPTSTRTARSRSWRRT